MSAPKVCIVGSLRFYTKMIIISGALSRRGILVLLPKPGRFRSPANPGRYTSYYGLVSTEEKVKEDTERVEEHLQKIKDSDLVLLVNPGGYFGFHTLGEIYVAHEHRKPIYALTPIPEEAPPVVAGWIERILSPEEFVALLEDRFMNKIAGGKRISRSARALS